jgi:hypothetical protein
MSQKIEITSVKKKGEMKSDKKPNKKEKRQ